jgi:hypothetical protein
MVNGKMGIMDLNESERQRCEVWTRVMGYYRPVSEFNPGKKSEHYERKHFVESDHMGQRQECCLSGKTSV